MRNYLYNVILTSAAAGMLTLLCGGEKRGKSLRRVMQILLVFVCAVPLLDFSPKLPELPDMTVTYESDSGQSCAVESARLLCRKVEDTLKERFGIAAVCEIELDTESYRIERAIIKSDGDERIIRKYAASVLGCENIEVSGERTQ